MIDIRPTENCFYPPRVYSQQYVDELKAKYGWHTGTPTEEGWYLLALTTKVFNDKPFCVAYMDGHHWLGIDDFYILVDDVSAWQKIEPYEASEERE